MATRKIGDAELIAYAAGELAPEVARNVAAYLDREPGAAAFVQAYREIAAAAATDDGVAAPRDVVERAKAIAKQQASPSTLGRWLDRIDRIVAQLVYDSRVQPAAVRYADSGGSFQLSFQADETDIDLQAERLPETDEPRRWRLIGQVSRNEAAGEVEVALLAAGTGEPVTWLEADERAMFVLDVAAGAYDLRIRVDDAVIVIEGMEIG